MLAQVARPSRLEDMVGQQDVVAQLRAQVRAGRTPHFVIISGPTGGGKTTFARILARELPAGDPAAPVDVRYVNAADANGVEDSRAMCASLRFQPMPPFRGRVLLLDEAHMLTPQAQNVLLAETEEPPRHAFFIFCTTLPSKILPALRRRAYVLTPKPLTGDDTLQLLRAVTCSETENTDDRASEARGGCIGGCTGQRAPVGQLADALERAGVSSPGLVLQAADRFFAGMTADEAVLASDGNGTSGAGSAASLDVARAIAAGKWAAAAAALSEIGKADVVGARASVQGYLKAVLLKAASPQRALGVARAMRVIADSSSSHFAIDDLPAFCAACCIACEHVSRS